MHTRPSMLLATAGACLGCAVTASGAAATSTHTSAPTASTADAAAAGAPRTKLFATFVPKRLGAATTIGLSLNIAHPTYTKAPPPLSTIDVTYPRDLSFATSGLGLAACDPTALEEYGAEECPANSLMGRGHALAEVAFGPDIVPEKVNLSLFAGPSSDGYLHLLILAAGEMPVMGRVVLKAVLLPGHLQIEVPPVPGLPGGANIAFVSFNTTLGGALTYYERSHGRTIAYRPKGIGLPSSCPAGGWRLTGKLAFLNGQRSSTETVISCPRKRGRRHER
jgi:hypothetical protein